MKSTNRRCSHCRKKVSGDAIIGGLRAFCSFEHLHEFMKSDAGKKAAKKVHRHELRDVRERHKTKSDYTKEAQAAFNLYIRTRDAGKPCISCGSMPESYYGGGIDAGHFLARGSQKGTHKRFDTRNCHAQCKRCNRYLAGAVADFRDGLLARYGQDFVERLEQCDGQGPYSVDYLKRIKSIFTRRAKLYERLRGLK